VILDERVRPAHQGNVGGPEAFGRVYLLDQFRRAATEFVARDRTVAEHVTQAVAELAADFRDALVRGAAVRAGITAVLHQGDGCAYGTEDMVTAGVYRSIQPVAACFCLRHRVLGNPLIFAKAR